MNKYRVLTIITVCSAILFMDNCKQVTDSDRYVIISVKYAGAVTNKNKLWAIVFSKSNWTGELMRVSSPTKQIVIPTFNASNYTGYIAVVYDAAGNGNLQNSPCIGYVNVQYNTALNPFIFLKMKTMVIDLNLDAGLANFPTK